MVDEVVGVECDLCYVVSLHVITVSASQSLSSIRGLNITRRISSNAPNSDSPLEVTREDCHTYRRVLLLYVQVIANLGVHNHPSKYYDSHCFASYFHDTSRENI